MTELKQIVKESIPATLEKAMRYRLLNEPLQAESICRDVLAIEPANQQANVILLLAITDQFDNEFAGELNEAQALLPHLTDEYERLYYEGIINERWGNSRLIKGEKTSIGWYRTAMRCYAKAERLSSPDNDDAILRWNTCVRILERHDFAPETMTHDIEGGYSDEMPRH